MQVATIIPVSSQQYIPNGRDRDEEMQMKLNFACEKSSIDRCNEQSETHLLQFVVLYIEILFLVCIYNWKTFCLSCNQCSHTVHWIDSLGFCSLSDHSADNKYYNFVIKHICHYSRFCCNSLNRCFYFFFLYVCRQLILRNVICMLSELAPIDSKMKI